jgi:hypothetical protein
MYSLFRPGFFRPFSFLSIWFLFLTASASGQVYQPFGLRTGGQFFMEVVGNPECLNEDYEPIFNDPIPSGWTPLALGDTSSWLTQHAIPISFSWMGNPVSTCRIHPRGYLTFSKGQTQPARLVSSLPNATVPDSTICLGNLKPTLFSRIQTKVFGTAPKRQWWIQFSHFQDYGLSANETDAFDQISMSIVLSENQNSIFLVKQNSNYPAVELSCPMGLQLHANQAVLYRSFSPKVNAYLQRGIGPSNNLWYGFFWKNPGPQVPPRFFLNRNATDIPTTPYKWSNFRFIWSRLGYYNRDSITFAVQLDQNPVQLHKKAFFSDTFSSYSDYTWLRSNSGQGADTLLTGNHFAKIWIPETGNVPGLISDTLRYYFYKGKPGGQKRLTYLTFTSKYCPQCPAKEAIWNQMYNTTAPYTNWAQVSMPFGPDPFVIPKSTPATQVLRFSSGLPNDYGDFSSNSNVNLTGVLNQVNAGSYFQMQGEVEVDTNTYAYRLKVRYKSDFSSMSNRMGNFRLVGMLVVPSISGTIISGTTQMRQSVRDLFGTGLGYSLPPFESQQEQDWVFEDTLLGRDYIPNQTQMNKKILKTAQAYFYIANTNELDQKIYQGLKVIPQFTGVLTSNGENRVKTRGQLRLLPGEEPGTWQIENLSMPSDWIVSDASGKTLRQGTFQTQGEILRLHGLPAGLYIFRCSVGNARLWVSE